MVTPRPLKFEHTRFGKAVFSVHKRILYFLVWLMDLVMFDNDFGFSMPTRVCVCVRATSWKGLGVKNVEKNV